MKRLPTRLPMRHVVMALVFILGVAGLVEWMWLVPNYGAGVDEASYLLAAKGIALHGDPVYVNGDPTVFVPENMVEAEAGKFYPIYPIGYPMICAVAYRIGGPVAAFYVNPVMMLVGLVGAFMLARFFLDDVLALAATFFLGVNPALLYFGVAAMSHAADFACATWCMAAGYAWYVRPAWWKAAGAGLLLGYAVSIRYTEILLALPLGFLVVCRARDWWKGEGGGARGRDLAMQVGIAGVGALVAVMPLLWFHWHAFGSIWTTGYSLTGHAAAFSVRSFGRHWWFALRSLCQVPFGVSVFFPVAVMGMVWAMRREFRVGMFLILWIVPTLLLYMAYYWVTNDGPTDWLLVSRSSVLYVRFFVTIYPALMIGALLAAGWVTRRRWVGEIAVALGVVAVGSVHLTCMPEMRSFEGTAAMDQAAVRLAKENLPGDAVMVADRYMGFSLVYFTDMTVYYPLYFSPQWVAARLKAPAADSDSPADFSPLRRKRFAEALGNRTGPELNAILRERLLGYARAGRTIGLVINTETQPWWTILDEAFVRRKVAEDRGASVELYRLEPRAGVGR